MQPVKNTFILILLAVTVAAAYIDSRDPRPEWWQSMQTWLKYSLAKPESETSTKTASSSQTKTIETTEQFDTPVGSLVIIKYSGDECLYAKAIVAHANYYGSLKNLMKQLKDHYKVNCLFWE
ncbi:hypothetical protein [Nostoc sp.]|uniref:hypothetical protein n=1 Tax=Nostoc sp. TaxID=1180 RepID=UPI002FF82B03